MKTINIAKDFSLYPGGRYPADGEFSGEVFRKEMLVPALQHSPKITIELDGTRGYGSSFLEESFGGLVREEGFDRDKLLNCILFVTALPSLRAEIQDYIREAAQNQQ